MENNTLRGYNNHMPVNCVSGSPGFMEKYPQRSESSHSGSLGSSNSSIGVSVTDSSKKLLYENSVPDVPSLPKRPPFPRPTDPSHIYSIPLKNSRLFYNILFEDQRPQTIPDYTYLDSATMSCSFIPTQCDSNCNPSKQATGEEGSSLKCNNNKRKSMCPLCGLEGSAETIQSHMEDCESIETSVCGQCTEVVHRGILSYHLQYVCSKRQVFCKSCGQNFVADKIQGHQSNCNLSNKAWANDSSLSPHSTVDKHTNQQHEKTSCDPTSSICQQINNSKNKLMPRARSSDTFEHPGKLQGHHPIQIDGSPALSFVGNMRGHSTTPAVNHGDPSGAFANVGYGALFAKLEMLNKSVEGSSEPDEHTDQQAVIFPCIFRDAGCHFQGTHYALSKHLDESMKLHLAMTYSVMQHQQKQLLMVTSALAATLNPNTDGSLIWKVRNFSERLLDAKSGKRTEFQSPVFYTSRFGYKMTLVLYPDGIGSAKGSHISIFLKILRGDFDQFLTWPFPHTLKIALLSQDQTRQHIVQRINQKFNVLNETASSSNGSHGSRDHSSPTANQSSSSSPPTLIGLTRFVSQELLLSSQQYLMEDTLCVCGSVVNSDSNTNFKQPEIFPRTSEI